MAAIPDLALLALRAYFTLGANFMLTSIDGTSTRIQDFQNGYPDSLEHEGHA